MSVVSAEDEKLKSIRSFVTKTTLGLIDDLTLASFSINNEYL